MCKHVKIFRSSQTSISMNFCTKFSKAKFSIVKIYRFHFTMIFKFLFHFISEAEVVFVSCQRLKVSFYLNGVLFPQEIWNEKILLCIVITWKLKAEKIKWFYHETWRYKLLKKSNKYYSKFDSLKKWFLTFNHSAPNCMKTLLIIFSPKVTS